MRPLTTPQLSLAVALTAAALLASAPPDRPVDTSAPGLAWSAR